MSELGRSTERAELAASLLLTDPGVPFLYYGEEIGVQGRKPDERLRAPMPWTGDPPAGGFSTTAPWQAMPDGWPEVSVAAQAGDSASLLAAYRNLIRVRSEHPALRTGATFTVDAAPSSLVAMLRSTEAESMLVLSNLGVTPVAEYTLTLDDGPLCGAGPVTILYGPGSPGSAAPPIVTPRGGFDAWKPVAEIPPRSTLILSLAP
jgi:glycosidase